MYLKDKYILSLILNYLDPKSLCVAQSVCNVWSVCVIEHKLWKSCYLNTFNHTQIRVPSKQDKLGAKKTYTLVHKLHKPLDCIADLNFKALYEQRLRQSWQFAPQFKKNSICIAPDNENVMKNKGKRVATWGMYQHSRGVMMNCAFGFSDWLSLLGFTANYYEVNISGGSFGMSQKEARRHSHIGWDLNTIGYHSDDGSIHINGRAIDGKPTPSFGEADIVGFGFYYKTNLQKRQKEQLSVKISKTQIFNFFESSILPHVSQKPQHEQMVYFTCNGVVVHECVFETPCDKLYPKICMQDTGDQACFNMGNQAFVFDVVDYLISKTKDT